MAGHYCRSRKATSENLTAATAENRPFENTINWPHSYKCHNYSRIAVDSGVYKSLMGVILLPIDARPGSVAVHKSNRPKCFL